MRMTLRSFGGAAGGGGATAEAIADALAGGGVELASEALGGAIVAPVGSVVWLGGVFEQATRSGSAAPPHL